MKSTVIDIENAVVSYREDIALRGLSLKVRSEEFVGIIGPNGAGKTTLLTIVNGLGKLLHGRVSVLGHYITPGNGHSLRKQVGYVAQVQNIDPRMPISVREVVMIGRYGLLGLLRRPSRHDWEIVDEVLALVGMSHLTWRPIGHLSGGEQQRVAIARCLAQEPELFLLDEPTASLDWKAQSGILELVKQIHDSRHLTTLFVTHDLSCLPVACGRVVLMKEGLIWGEGSPDELLTDANLSQLYDMPISAVVRLRKQTISVQD
ncbi:MAG TPA: metal ABC transporter ATP-binding protein [Dehalococcoidia bacterium]|jgi:ABC-type cobalamin/Fe3+-siderophores transport system ATPase subunit|nr:metal ABC transporter ATP-binding protein [Dehalococcoidia bacterium]